ncbi:ribonuclease P protein component [Candidatus Saccharibacteria bacterium]|nr:ribonuclease P protein component [Candidatus Saccharibacteria bacterium]
MISRIYRFHGHNSLRFVYAKGRSTHSSLLSIRYAVNAHRKNYRCAVVVSKKVNKSAVIRNRIRRRIYEQLRIRSDLQQKNIDLVVTVRSDKIATLPTEELQKLINDLLLQAFTNLNNVK